ncbi:hypothetical protein EV384_4932 [Micromonospora kangleipakensis]|uniref:Uncharacterized protein n=1 Tax=Micromonospora kangleipakensis TaxID=1077942 RepID=A0A4Q8BFV6_9ACTN|nr:hypothetical protein [Micromonospora kangleipakensis]RZU76295.1 hypothetical protein EV384_4932 [Micromonospora kangleipakensis]
MTSHDTDRPTLFLAMPTVDGLDGPDVTFDGSEEAMRRLRHPFAVNTARLSQQRTPMASDGSEQRD